MSYIDLHMHSNYSDDGEYSPQELVDLCTHKNIKYFSISDHNSASGIEEASEYCKGKNIEIIPAIELDCHIDGVNLHVLGYGIDHNNLLFKQIGENIVNQEQQASRKRMNLVRSLGIQFSDEVIHKLSRNGVVTGEMIGEAALIFDKDKSNPKLQPYRETGSRSDNPYVNFYWDYCAQGKPAYVEIRYISLADAIVTIEEAGGIPILAHPGNNVKENKELLEKIANNGIKGLEVYSSYHNKEQETFYKKFSIDHNLLITSGSDFHGRIKPSIQIGSTDCEGNEDGIIKSLLNALKHRKHITSIEGI